jgi:hypothetical protein
MTFHTYREKERVSPEAGGDCNNKTNIKTDKADGLLVGIHI